MNSFEKLYIERLPITQNLLRTVRPLGEFKGKQELFTRQIPQALETLRQAAIIQSTESSNRIEGVTAPIERIKALVAEKTSPRDRSEQEILGYRDALNTIHTSYPDIPFTTNVVLQFHGNLYRYTESQGGKWKSVDNEIREELPETFRITDVEQACPQVTRDMIRKVLNQLRADGKLRLEGRGLNAVWRRSGNEFSGQQAPNNR